MELDEMDMNGVGRVDIEVTGRVRCGGFEAGFIGDPLICPSASCGGRNGLQKYCLLVSCGYRWWGVGL